MQVEYDEDMDVAYFDGLTFRRDKHTGYYLNSATHKRLHRYIWEYYYGPIPDGCHVHHIDEDKGHNDIENLVCMARGAHLSLHMNERAKNEYGKMIQNLDENARPAASAWHKSAEGRAWHREHWEESIGTIKPKEHVCQNCGKTYYSKGAWSKFCSNTCKAAARRKSGIDNEARICPVCGKEFVINKYAGTRCCSRGCANALRWHNKSEAKA